MKNAITLLLTFILWSCAATEKSSHQTENASSEPPKSIETISKDIDTPPEPIGGTAAIQAAINAPEEVWKENKTGWVIVEATINSNGRVIATNIVKSSGYTGMDSEAMLAVARAAWKPARRKGTPVAATVRVPVLFENE